MESNQENYFDETYELVKKYTDDRLLLIKIQSAKNEWDYKLVKWLAMEKKPIVMEVRYELNNHCRTKIRNSIDQEINWYEDRRDEDGFIRFDF